MIANALTERQLTDWLAAQADSSGADRVLHAAIATVATAGQERYITQRVFGDGLGRSYNLRLALAVVGLILAVVGTAVVGSALLRREPVPPPPPTLSNGLVAFVANGQGGDHLEVEQVDRNGDRDIYVVGPGQPPRRLVGSGNDSWHQGCPTFLADGHELAYLELEIASLTPTAPPHPANETPPPPPPPSNRTPHWAIVVANLDDAGDLGTEIARVDIETNGLPCPLWSPDGQHYAYRSDVDGGSAVWLGLRGGHPELLNESRTEGVYGIAWSPDSERLAVTELHDSRVGLFPVDGGAPTWFSVPSPELIAWSPDGTQLAVAVGHRIDVVQLDGTLVGSVETDTGQEQATNPLWSPDGEWLAWVDATGELVRANPSTNVVERRALDVEYGATILCWSPDGTQALVQSGGFDTPGSLLAVPWDSSQQPTVLVGPTFAMRGTAGDWQGVAP